MSKMNYIGHHYPKGNASMQAINERRDIHFSTEQGIGETMRFVGGQEVPEQEIQRLRNMFREVLERFWTRTKEGWQKKGQTAYSRHEFADISRVWED